MKRTALITLFALLLVSVITNVPNTSAQVSAWHINAGGADYTAGNGDVFVADKAYVAGDFGYTGNKRDFSFTNAIANTDDDPIYQDVASNKNFSYLFDVPNGDYNVTLYFMEPWQDAVGERVFDVSMEGAVVLDNYDIYAAAGARYTAVTETIAINVSDGTLNINFDFVNRYAMVAAISVVSGTPPVPAPEITVAPTSLDYGDVVNGTDSDLSVTVTNDGTDFLDISSLSTTNPSFAVISPTAPLSITMGSSEIVTVRFSPTVTGLYTDTLDIASNDTDEPVVSVALSGNGVEAPPNEPDIAVSPTSVDFGNVAPGGTADQIVTIDNVGLQLLSVSALSTDNGVFTIVSPTAPFDVAAGASQDVTVRFSPTVDGVENGNLTITSNDPDEGTVVVSLTGTGASTPAVAYRINAGGPNYTDTLGNLFVADKAYTAGDFGFTGNKRDFSFTNPVANTDDDALYQDLAANIAFSYLFDLPNGNYDVTLYFMEPWQSAAGERLFDVTVEGTLILDDYDIFVASGGQYTAVTEIIPVTVSDGQLNIDFARVNRYAMVAAISVVSEGGGPPPTDPDISVSPASLNFGQVQLGNTADQIVNVNNVGGQILTVSSITSSNGVFTIVSPTTPFDVGVSGSQAVTVRYTPTAVMVDNGDLTITSNDPDEGTVIVPMTGEGTDTPPPTTNYVNVTTSAGISSSHVINTSICAPDNNPPIGNGAAWGDYDGDGDVDVYLTSQSGTNWLYSNDGDGTFTNVTTSAGVAAVSHTSTTTVFIDYDNDGDQDLFVGGHGGNLFFENNGNGTFTDVTATTGLTDGGRAMTTGWADFNEDGFLDVYIAKHKLCAGDDQQEDKLFINDGDGTFTDVTTAYLCGGTAQCANVMGLGFVPGWLDYDNDGDLDLFLVNDDIGGAYQPTKLWRNDGSDGVGGWNFTEVSVAANASYSLNGMGLGTGDYNNDGYLDLAFSNMGAAVLLSNDGDGTFTDQSSSTIIGSVTSGGVTWGTAFFDHDNDGDLDLYYVNGSLGGGGLPNYFFDNNGAGSFTDQSAATGLNDGGKARGLAIADFNADGFIDVLVVNYGEAPALLENQGNSNNWLSVTVEGTESNRDAIGARITLTAGGVSQIREINSGHSHGGGDQRLALFGMGGNTSGTLVIDWPNGVTQNLGTVSAGQALHFVEPAGNPGGTTYVDVTAVTGITAVDVSPAAGCGVPAGNGIAWGDYNNDGLVDVYMANHNGANYLYRNDGDTDSDNLPNFTDVTAAVGAQLSAEVSMSAVFVDYDNDGDQDLYVTNDGGNTLFENQLIESGTATFINVTAVAGVADTGRAVTSAWADFNNDSYLDFYVAKHMPCTLDNDDNLYMNNGDGTFTEVTSYLCGGAASCAQVEGLGFSPAFFDYDNDGDMDLHLVNDDIGGVNYHNVLWRNDGPDGSGGWTFTDVSTTSGTDVSLNGMGQGIGDWNNDGWLDIAYSNGAPGRLMENNGDGTFTDMSGSSGITTIINEVTWGTVFFDYDNDGDLDLYYDAGEVAAQSADVRNYLLSNNGDGTFTDVSAASGTDDPGRSRSASIVDIDNDGFVDLMVGNYGGAYHLYRNAGATQGNANNWLTITVEGTESNRDAIGTRISVTAGGVTQIREINSGPTHGGGDYRAGFFGLGANTSATVSIQWPNGIVENLGTVTAGQALHRVEPASVLIPDIDAPASFSFGDVETGTERDKLITVSNLGTGDLTITSLTTTDAQFAVVGPTTPAVVAAGGSVNVTVGLTPTSDGVKTADLVIVSDDPDEGSISVALSGTGVTAASTTFVNVISAAGIDPTHTLGGICNPPIGAGSTWADYDNDGDIDVYITDQGVANSLYRNDGDTNSDGVPDFTDVAATYGLEDAAGMGHATNFIDYDNDGDQDLYVSNWGASVLYQNQLIETGSVAFTDVTATAGLLDDGRTVTAAWADFDNDGNLDVYLAKHAYCGGSDPRNGDKLYHSNGDGTFTDVTSYLCTTCDPIDHSLGFSGGWVDYDNDGDLDLYVVNDVLQGDGSGGTENYHNVMWRNDGSDGSGGWLFTETSTPAGVDKAVNGMGLGIGDYDNDGDYDIAFSDIGASTLYSNDGDGTFTDVSSSSNAGTGSLTWGTAFFDYNNDGWLDLFFASGLVGAGGSTPDIFLENNANGTFTDISVVSGLNNDGRGRHAAMVDFDQDGLVDLFVGNYGTPQALYQNRADAQGNTNNWLFVTVEGTDSNRDGIGTKLTLTAGGITQIRTINSGSTHGGGDYRAAYFGLGTATSGTLTIDWPNGQTEVISIGSGDINQYRHEVEPSSGPPPATTFAEVTGVVGMTTTVTQHTTVCDKPPMGSGSAWGDYDNDGDLDVYMTNHGGANYLYRNDGDTSGDGLPDFTNVAATMGVENSALLSLSAVFIDYDNDGDQDLYVSNWDGNSLFENQLVETGSVSFVDVATTAGVVDAGRAITTGWGDFNNDGWLDLYVAKHRRCAGDPQSEDHLYQSNGDGTFTNVSSYLCGGASTCAQLTGLGFTAGWFDYDNDGDPDLYVVNDDIGGAQYPNVLWRNDGSDGSGGWTFTDVSTAAGLDVSVNGMGLGVGDYDNDGFFDVAFSNIAPARLMHNNGDGTFSDVSGASGVTATTSAGTWGTAFFDYDNDTDLDLYYVSGGVGSQTTDYPNFLMSNDGNGTTFTDVSAASGLNDVGWGRSASMVDFDGDGWIDILVGNYLDGYYLYHNDSVGQGNTNHWLSITVEGTESNRDGIGTRISLTAGGVTQIREISSGSTHGGGDYRAAYFGLGSDTSATVTIQWPNGVVENLGSVAVDQEIHRVEPSSAPPPATTFVDVASQVGMSLPHTLSSTVCAGPPLGTGTAWADYDNDGDIDVFVVNNGAANWLYRNDGDTSGDGLPDYTNVAVAAGVDDPAGVSHAAVFIDYDNDGDQDLYVTNWDDGTAVHGNILYKNQLIESGSATFTDVTATAGLADDGRAITSGWADYDQDGYLDVYLAKHTACGSDPAALLQDHLYHNNGDGTFTDVSQYLCTSTGGVLPCPTDIEGRGFMPGWFDFDNDGDQDLYLVNDWNASTNTNRLWRNDGSDGSGGWTFVEISATAGVSPAEVNGMGLGIGDPNNDGWLDLAFSDVGLAWLYLNDQDGTFTDISSSAGMPAGVTWGTAFFDYDNDGWEDLFLAGGSIHDPVNNPADTMLRNRGGEGFVGQFDDVSTATGLNHTGRGRAVSTVDFDQDGHVDLMVGNYGQDYRLYRNYVADEGNTNHWLTVTVEGTASNRDAIGARIILTTSAGTQIREINSGWNHGGGSYRAAYFGLGTDTSGTLEIRWPDGTTQVIGAVTADQALHYVEP